jgi:hypothetical protein
VTITFSLAGKNGVKEQFNCNLNLAREDRETGSSTTITFGLFVRMERGTSSNK